jgi:nucleoside-diphosphate-sugar epimerase
MSKRILILGVNGFIGSHLTEAILKQTDWQIVGLDLSSHKITEFLDNPRLRFHQANMLTSHEWIENEIKNADVVLPLVAIATPQTYVSDPLKVFELDFEANLPIVRMCVTHGKRLVFPSTSEVYGMSPEAEFKEYESNMVLGPVSTPRWIYSTCKQLMDRIIIAYGLKNNLQYTLFRPFNWYGPKLDDLNGPKSRVLTAFISQILQGEDLILVDGGAQRRSFTYITDGIDALMRILKNENDLASQRIFNIGNPSQDYSIRELAETLLKCARENPSFAQLAKHVQWVDKSSGDHYGVGYQDVQSRVPSIDEARTHLGWEPKVTLAEGLALTLTQVPVANVQNVSYTNV